MLRSEAVEVWKEYQARQDKVDYYGPLRDEPRLWPGGFH